MPTHRHRHDNSNAPPRPWWMPVMAMIMAPHLLAAAGRNPQPQAPAVYRGHGLAMHGKLKYGAGFKHFDYADPAAPKGGTLRLSAQMGFDSLNPYIMRGRPAAGLGLTYDRLMVGSNDEAFSEYGLVAKSVEVPADRSWIVFHLRPRARWHDGRPITADDVIFTFNTLVKQGAPFYRFYYRNVKQVAKLGPLTVRFSFAGKGNRELPLIIGQLPVLPRHYWRGKKFGATTLTPPLGSGPYRIKEMEANRYIVYERVKDYWGRNLPVRKGFYNYDRIRYDYFRDDVVTLEAFKAGKFDIRFENTAKYWATAYDIPAVRDQRLRKLELPHRRAAGTYGLVFNSERRIFADRRVRLALAHAFDFEWTNKKLFYGAYKRSRSYFGNCELEARGLPTGEELTLLRRLAAKHPGKVPPEVFTREYNPPTTGEWRTEREHLRRVRINLLAARDLLRAAGWHIRKSDRLLVNDGIRDASGRPLPFAFEILLVSPGFERIVLPFARTLRRLGVSARVRTVDSAQYRKRITDFDYDMIVAVWGQSLSPGNEQRNYWSSRAAATKGSRNYCRVRNPAVDELIDLLIHAPSRASLVARTRALDRVLQWGYYLVPCWFLDYDRVACWDKFGRPAITPRNGVEIMTWWIDPRRAARLK